VPLLAVMLATAPAGPRRVGVAIYAAGLCSMLLASTTYHRWVHTIRWRAIWRRADHAMIFMAIAGTATPLCVAVLPGPAAIGTLAVLWGAALVGAAIKLTCWQRGERVATAMYITNGWAGLALVPAMVVHGFLWPSLLLVAGGVVYTVGAVGFTRQWPTLNPSVFSYHEVWHVCTLTGAAAHFAAVWIIV
jgi:hemolysin III